MTSLPHVWRSNPTPPVMNPSNGYFHQTLVISQSWPLAPCLCATCHSERQTTLTEVMLGVQPWPLTAEHGRKNYLLCCTSASRKPFSFYGKHWHSWCCGESVSTSEVTNVFVKWMSPHLPAAPGLFFTEQDKRKITALIAAVTTLCNSEHLDTKTLHKHSKQPFKSDLPAKKSGLVMTDNVGTLIWLVQYFCGRALISFLYNITSIQMEMQTSKTHWRSMLSDIDWLCL